jgi:hypothetical protein
MSKSNLISEIELEILQLRDTITFCHNQILRKEIVLLEILRRNDEEIFSPRKTELARSTIQHTGELSAAEMFRQCLPQLNGTPFKMREFSNLVALKFPSHEKKIKKQAYYVRKSFLSSGIFEADGGKLRIKKS